MLAALIPALLPVLGRVLDRAVPDAAARQAAEAELLRAMLASQAEIDRAASEVLKAEIGGESWLQRSWRPITMLTFLGCIVGYWFGLTPVTLPDSAVAGMFDLLQIGLGGYIVGRSAEKIVRDLPGKGSPLDAWRAGR